MNHCAHAESSARQHLLLPTPTAIEEHIFQHVLHENFGGETCFFGFVLSTKNDIQQQHREVTNNVKMFM
jgi:hypothetical protein